MIRKITGATLIALPIMAGIIALISKIGWIQTLIMMGIPILVVAMVAGGFYLLSDDFP
jgi:Ca2+/Na+ antiporter